MNEELQRQIVAILKQALEAAQHGGQWLSGQIPDVLHQLLVWNIAVGVISIAVELSVVLGLVFTVRKLRKYGENTYMPVAVIGGIATFFLSFFMFHNAIDGLKAFVAPKLFLLEYAAHLVK